MVLADPFNADVLAQVITTASESVHVDLQTVLAEIGIKTGLCFRGLPLPAPMGGQEAGMFGFPEEGTTVGISFAYGLPHKPVITQIPPQA
ncbi:hypothetical protein PHLH7_17860 [Pseudomonas sp. Ost2]|nr:hypothetical protein PHLH7_17860 [Pseudomonas sp. Ost2]